jgi:Mrp family chromosome partitioning ATPase
VIDTPPILTVADAMALAPFTEGVVLTVRAGVTPREMINQAMDRLSYARIKILGIVFNGVDLNLPDNSYNRRYYKNSYLES